MSCMTKKCVLLFQISISLIFSTNLGSITNFVSAKEARKQCLGLSSLSDHILKCHAPDFFIKGYVTPPHKKHRYCLLIYALTPVLYLLQS